MKLIRFGLGTVISLGLMATAQAGILGWLTSQDQDWSFVQATGGMRISAPILKDGRTVLPVEYYVQGSVAITCKPTLMNSGLAVRKVEATKRGSDIIIRIYTQVVEKGSDVSGVHFADLSGIPNGTYEVFYGTAGEPSRLLGRIEINRKRSE